MHQMPDQHRLNFTPHATQFLNPAAMRRPNFLQQMALQQQQFVHHLQLSQRQYMLQHGIQLQADLPVTQTPPNRSEYNVFTANGYAILLTRASLASPSLPLDMQL